MRKLMNIQTNLVGMGLDANFKVPIFREHMIQGDILPFMNLVELKDMGISLARAPRLAPGLPGS